MIHHCFSFDSDISLWQLLGHVNKSRRKKQSSPRKRRHYSRIIKFNDKIQKSNIESRRINKIIINIHEYVNSSLNQSYSLCIWFLSVFLIIVYWDLLSINKEFVFFSSSRLSFLLSQQRVNLIRIGFFFCCILITRK